MSTDTIEKVEVKIGDFFVSHWGYDQSNVDFARVVALTPKGVKIQAWRSKTVRTAQSADYVVPGDGPVTGGWVRGASGSTYDHEIEAPIQTKRLRASGRHVYLARNSFSSWSLWGGEPEYETASGFGH